MRDDDVRMGEDWRRDRVGSALRGSNPTVLAHLDASFAAIGDVQFLPGYCVALTDRPGIDRLTDLPRSERLRFLGDMDLLGEAVEQVCRRRDEAFLRVNLEILGNTDGFLHAHVWPRYGWEPSDVVRMPVWAHPRQRWTDPGSRLGPAHDGLRRELTDAIASLCGQVTHERPTGTAR